MQNARDILLATSRRLNDGIRALDATIEGGGPGAEAIATMRREAGEAMERLRSVQDASGVVSETIPKVLEHIDLFMEIASSAGSAPGLSRKLLKHLLEEQVELTAQAGRGGTPGMSAGTDGRESEAGAAAAEYRPATARTPGSMAARPAGTGSIAGPGAGVSGGRRALTVGSLIGR